MDRIKKLNESILLDDEVLCEIIELKSKSGLYLPDDLKGKKEGIDYMSVVAYGAKVTGIKEGDIIVLVPQNIKVTSFTYKDKDYGLIKRYNCSIIVDKDNFEA